MLRVNDSNGPGITVTEVASSKLNEGSKEPPIISPIEYKMSFSPAVHSCGGETETIPGLPCETSTYLRLGHKVETVASENCTSLLEAKAACLGRTKMRMTKDFVICATAFPAASEIVRLIPGGL